MWYEGLDTGGGKQGGSTYGGVPFAPPCAAASEGDLVQKGHIVPDHCCFTNHHPGSMVYHDASPQLCCRVHVYLQHL